MSDGHSMETLSNIVRKHVKAMMEEINDDDGDYTSVVANLAHSYILATDVMLL